MGVYYFIVFSFQLISPEYVLKVFQVLSTFNSYFLVQTDSDKKQSQPNVLKMSTSFISRAFHTHVH